MSSVPQHIIIRFLQNTISKEEEQFLHEWLRESRQNEELFCRFIEIWDSDKLMSNEAVIQSWEKLYKKLGDEAIHANPSKKNLQSDKKQYKISLWIRYAAAIFIGIMAIGAWYAIHQRNATTQIAQNVICNPEGVQEHTLPDSSIVWINAGSCLSYPRQFEKNIRQVTLDGTAYFEVTKNGIRSFVVKSGNTEVIVTGTEFVVNSSSEKNILVTLVSGGVVVNTQNERKKAATHVTLLPGQQASIDKHSGQIQVVDVDVDYYLTWKDGNYRFTDEPLEKIIRQLSWRFQVDIYVSQELKSRRFTGRVSPKHRIEDVLEIIQTSQSVNCTITPTGIYISEK